jgi:tripartite-type tricarboxylate transporter receptor subunit TctC
MVPRRGAGRPSLTQLPSGQGAYPDRVIKIIVPYAAGTSPDVVARQLATG